MNIDRLIKDTFETNSEKIPMNEDTLKNIINETLRTAKPKYSHPNKFLNKLKINTFIEGVIYVIAAFCIISVIKYNYLMHNKNQTNFNNAQVKQSQKIEQENFYSRKLTEFLNFESKACTGVPNIKSNNEEFNDIKSASDKVPFKILTPSYIPEGYKLNNVEVSSTDLGATVSHQVLITYKLDDITQLTINESDDKTAFSSIFSMTNQFEKISINGLDAYSNKLFVSKDDKAMGGEILILHNGIFYTICLNDDIKLDTLIDVVKSMSIEKQISEIPDEEVKTYTGNDEINAVIPFSIDYPKYIPDGYVESKPETLRITKSKSLTFAELRINYNVDSDSFNPNIISIAELNIPITQEKLLNSYEKINIGNTNAWFTKSENNLNQLMFFANNKFYDIMSVKQDKDTLIKVAGSMLK
ncbi:MAG: DUF4367 domain-containing protein [Bacillota bacterium]|nr:DUF4367 domain-containing protein [Bacillota bacterium]